MVGYTRAEVMHRSSSCSFMFGEQTDKETIRKIESCLQQYASEQLEVRLYKKNSKLVILVYHMIMKFHEYFRSTSMAINAHCSDKK